MKKIIGEILKPIVPNALKNSFNEIILLDKLTVAQLFKKFFLFNGTPKDRYVVIIVHCQTCI